METSTSTSTAHRRRWPWFAGAAILLAVLGVGWWLGKSKSQEAQAKRAPQAIAVMTAKAETRDVPVTLTANGTVTALQSVDLRSQVTSTVREVHIREGQSVKQGEILFSLDARADEANIRKAEAQVMKDRADLANAQRNLERQRELFRTKFISQAALDVAQNQVDTLNGQMAVDQAALESARVARGYAEIRAPFAGRTGTINVRAGSLVQPGGASTTTPALVTVTQIDPISVAFTLPEKELAGLQQALSAGPVEVTVHAQAGSEAKKGKVSFIDNAVDNVSGTIKVKAEFSNKDGRLWPGMYVNVQLAPRTLRGAVVVPAQAVQTGPENRFVYVVDAERKVESKPVKVAHVDEKVAVIEGIAPGTKVVTEGAQNLRPGATVTDAVAGQGRQPLPPAAAGKGPGSKGSQQ
ncbi:MAG TPA: efflux RND transporter periplasmic adaptor subunit [Usitatibacter sp.]|nr:efflux RND transporter periplasmic adaptor subunit [Usitatibacter sp.]